MECISIKQGMSLRARNKNHIVNYGTRWSVIVHVHCICLPSGISFTPATTLAWATGTGPVLEPEV